MIHLLRHGQDDENYLGGWSKLDLLPEGVKQIERASEFIKDNLEIRRILTSDIMRARESAEIVGGYLHIEPIIDKNLRELNKGKLNGMKVTDAIKYYPEYFQDVTVNTEYPDGESMIKLYERIKESLEDILLNKETLHVTHRGVINMIYYILNNIPVDMNKTRFDVIPGSIHEIDTKKRTIKRIH